MAANIFGDRFLGRREPAWHGLGVVFPEDEKVLCMDAFERANLLYQFHKVERTLNLPDGTRMPSAMVSLVREPTADDPIWREFGDVKPTFGLIQNVDLARALNRISDRWPLETVGALDYGRTTFVTFATGSYDVAGDQINKYLVVSDGKSGDQALRFMLTDIRVVCQNTLEAAWESRKTGRISFQHRKDVADDLALYVDLFEQIQVAQERQQRAFQIMADQKTGAVSSAQAKEIIAAAYPMPDQKTMHQFVNALVAKQGYMPASAQAYLEIASKDYDQKQVVAIAKNVATYELYQRLCETAPAIAGTAWCVYNAVAEMADNRTGENVESIAKSTLWGERHLERAHAFQKAAKIIGLKEAAL